MKRILSATVAGLAFISVCAATAMPHAGRVTPTVSAVAEVLPSVVNLSTERVLADPYGRENDSRDFLHGFRNGHGGDTRLDHSLGSGCIIDESGYILTCAHVVRRATRISVTLYDGSRYFAKIIASDEINDIALLKITGLPDDRRLLPVRLAAPGDLLLGESVIVVGNPYGLGSTVSQGILSAVGRKVVYQGKIIFSDIIQTDAPVYPGNSGGPLINIDGEMIGISAAVHREARGIGFAIPLQRVENTLARWLVPERFGNVILGFVPGNKRLECGRIKVFVQDVTPESPAWRGGLRPGMEIVAVNGVACETVMPLLNMMRKAEAGWNFAVTAGDGSVYRFAAENLTLNDGRMIAAIRLGLGVRELTPELARAMDYPIVEGVVVSTPDTGTPGIRRGDLLVQIGDTVIYGFKDIALALLRRHYGDTIPVGLVSIERQGGRVMMTRRVVAVKVR